MAVLTWDDLGERLYENGVNKCVLYTEDGSGVAWNGITEIEEENNDSLDPLYYDGFKYGDLVTLGDFEGTLKAFTYPDEFLPYQGILEADSGVYLTSQVKTRFGLSWQTEINNDLGVSIGYKIHILWNVLAIQQDKTYQTLSLDNAPIEFEWNITAIPEMVSNFRPTAYLVIDSRKLDPFLLADIEALLYGSEDEDPQFPPLEGLIIFINNWGRFIVQDLGDGIWAATSPLEGVITMLDAESFEITADTVEFIDSPTNETFEASSDEGPVIP